MMVDGESTSTGDVGSSSSSAGATAEGSGGASAAGKAAGVSGGSGGTGETAGAAAATAGALDPAAPVAPAYTPNFKFKYRGLDKNDVEAELDDLFKPLVKDADTEKKIRELHEKAHGLDFVKADRDRLKSAYEPLEQKFESQAQALTQLGQFVQKKDYQSFFEALRIPKEDILQYALREVQLAQMDPQQRAQYEAQRQESQRAHALEMQNQQLQQQFQQLTVNQREMELGGVLQRAEVAASVASFDQRMGRPGAFRDLVIQRGQYHALALGVDAPAEQVVSEVLAMIGAQAAAAGQAATGNAAGSTVQAGSGGKPVVIPNIQGKGTSPAKKIPHSTNDLRKLAAQMSAE